MKSKGRNGNKNNGSTNCKQSTNRGGRRNTSNGNRSKRNFNAKNNNNKDTRQKFDKNMRRDQEIADTVMSETNAVVWYTKYAGFALDAGTLPFSSPLGEVFNFFEEGSGTNVPFAQPGVMRIRFSPTIGVAKDFTAPINRSSINFFSYLRSIQKASGDYDHQDISMMTLSIDSASMFHALGRRLYAVLRNFTPVNTYYPRALVGAMGFSFNDIKGHIADLRAYLNEFAYALGQYALPSDITLFDRHRWMCEGLYVDSNNTKAQTYMFVPQGFWQYDNTVETGSQLVYKEWLGPENTQTQHTFQEFVDFGNSLINAISNEQDFATISGDLQAFYNGNVYTIPFTEELYTVLPSYDPTVLSQIENLSIVGHFDSGYTPTISQNPNVNQGAIVFKPVVNLTGGANDSTEAYQQVFMNMHNDHPSPDQVMEATRLMALTEFITGTSTANVVACGTEIVHSLDVYTVNPATNNFRSHEIHGNDYSIDPQTDRVVLINIMNDLTSLAQFDWAPRMSIISKTATGVSEYLGSSWDADNFAPISRAQLTNLHKAALYSLFATKQAGVRDRAAQ